MLRGEVYELRGSRGVRGHEQHGRRFGLVLQATELLELSTVIVAPTSTRARPATFRPEIAIAGRTTRVLVEQLGAVDHSRLGDRVGRVTSDELIEVDDAARTVLGL